MLCDGGGLVIRPLTHDMTAVEICFFQEQLTLQLTNRTCFCGLCRTGLPPKEDYGVATKN